MEPWVNWVIGISVAAVAIALVLLIIFVILLLIQTKRTLQHTDRVLRDTADVVEDVEEKLHALTPYFDIAEGVGDVLERKTEAVFQKKNDPIGRRANVVVDALEWAAVGVSLWDKFRSR